MKTLILTLGLMAFGATAQAQSLCYEFQVKKFSPALVKVSLEMKQKNGKGYSLAVMKGFNAKGDSLAATFECRPSKNHQFCVQPEGAGDFSFSLVQRRPVLKLAYVNLAIAHSTGAEDEIIGEEFSLFDVQNAGGANGEDEADHMDGIRITGSEVRCP